MKYHLVKEQDEVDSEGYKQSKEPQVVEIPGHGNKNNTCFRELP